MSGALDHQVANRPESVSATPAPPEGSVLRLAVAMRGGVSLAVWIGGALAEIDHVRRCQPGGCIEALLATTRFGRVEVDILTGASAGGLNAALGGAAIATGHDPSLLRTTWIETADLDRLLQVHSTGDVERRSLLDGTYFLSEMEEQLKTFLAATPPPESPTATKPAPVEIFLAATLFGGLPVTEPDDPTFTDKRREAYFHFRHIARKPGFSDFDGTFAPHVALAQAARATASFPGAFEPEPLDTKSFDGRLRLPPGATAPATVRFYDGGVVDNIPVARAIRAATASPAQEAVRRWVVFLHPSPSLDRPDAVASDEIPSIVDVVKDVIGSRGTETLLDDLEVLRQYNRESEAQRLERYSRCEAAFEALGPVDPEDAMASVDADRLYALLDDPVTELGWLPIGVPLPTSPIASLSPAQRHALRMGFLAEMNRDRATLRPFARIVRLAHLVIEWIRWVENERLTAEPDLRRQVYDILLVARLIDAAVDREIVTAPQAQADRLRGATGTKDLVAILRAALHHARTDPRLGDVVEAMRVPVPGGGDGWQALADRLDAEPAETLAGLAAGCLPQPWPERGRAVDGAALDRTLLDGLAEAGRELARRDIDGAGAASLFTLLRSRLGPAPAVTIVRRHLLAVDGVAVGVHRGRALGVPMALDYLRISGAARSPLVAGAKVLRRDGPSLQSVLAAAGGTDPRTKLSGNTLANFSAFVSPRFRANDWMWGRLDAAVGLVDILLRPEHLRQDPELERSLERTVTSPFTLLVDGPRRSSAERMCRTLWEDHQAFVHEELASPGSPLAMTRELVTFRWQLEIFLAEVDGVLALPLYPGGRPAEVVGPADVAAVMAAYDASPRRLGDLWGDRKTTALGVRSARSAARGLVFGHGAINLARRTLLAAPLMVAAAAVLARGAFLVAMSLLVNILLVPRLATAARGAAVIGSAALSWLFWRNLVRREAVATQGGKVTGATSPWRGWLALAATVVAHLFGAVTVIRHHGPPLAPLDRYRSSAPWHGWGDGGDLATSMLFVGVAAMVAASLLWSWAKRTWQLTVAVASGVVMAAWVPISAWVPDGHTGAGLKRLSWIGSMWIPAALLLAMTTAIALVGQPEDREARTPVR